LTFNAWGDIFPFFSATDAEMCVPVCDRVLTEW